MKILLTSFSLFAGGMLLLQAQSTVPLLENSPFMPPGQADAGSTSPEDQGPRSLAKLQLRGITSIDGEYIFSIYNPDTRESKWITQGQSEAGLTIQSYDPDRNSVVIYSEAENLSRQMEMNDYSAPSGLRAAPTQQARQAVLQNQGNPSRTTAENVTPTGTLVRTQQQIQRPTRRNLEALRARRAELAEKLRKQPKPGTSEQDTAQDQR